MFLTRHETILSDAHATHSTYLFQTDKAYDGRAHDSGDKGVGCARKVDAFKLWLVWKTIGTSGLARLVEHAVLAAKYLAVEARRRQPHFRMVLAELLPEWLEENRELAQCTAVSFWYVPPALLQEEERLGEERFRSLLGKVCH